jgi:DNA-binding PadR family transcriptional regulator
MSAPRNPRMTLTTLLVLRELLAEPGREVYGLQVRAATGICSGTLYPILGRLEEKGWTTSRWEDIYPPAEGRPPRRYYRLTELGDREARAALARWGQRLNGAAR